MKNALRHYVFVLMLGVTACASLPLKQKAVVSLQASETALEASHDAERLLCSPTSNQALPIKTCDGPTAASIGLTTAKHQELARIFSKAFDTEIKAATVLKAWRAGDPPPASVTEYQRDVNAVLILVSHMIPNAHSVISKAQQAVDTAAAVVTLIGVTP